MIGSVLEQVPGDEAYLITQTSAGCIFSYILKPIPLPYVQPALKSLQKLLLSFLRKKLVH
jgi:hypothetical protein